MISREPIFAIVFDFKFPINVSNRGQTVKDYYENRLGAPHDPYGELKSD